ncbi:hypothetical protein DL769_010049 [Monosporascus sp. CRB-8-3]|nr:hypothetical protein DL769_010049 [Monosporascus sp. CRB-8-3]
MFRFWSSDSRGCDKTLQVEQSLLSLGKPLQTVISSEIPLTTSPRPPKRRRQSSGAIAPQPAVIPSAPKRPRICEDISDDGREDDARLHKKATLPSVKEKSAPLSTLAQLDMERAREVIENELGLEILLKHDELRLINQELAKCQVALEQLRRCHLIPYPVNVPTPEQMLNIVNGSGPALKPKPSETLPQWAPPFGVTDGPYARHYAKWLIPDPKFDGIHPEPLPRAETARLRTSMESRSMRNGLAELGYSQTRGRPVRGTAGQKLHSLTGGYPQPKGQAGPCILKRGDGQTVKLVCIDCHRENFSSTQGFINHCRIAHKRDFKSHEEAAIHCGHPIEAAESRGSTAEQRPAVQSVPASGLVHPLARENAMSESEACFSVVRRIEQLADLYRRRENPGVPLTPRGVQDSPRSHPTNKTQKSFTPSADSPNLSKLLQTRGFSGNLDELVSDAKTKIDLADVSSPDEEPEEADVAATPVVNETSGQGATFAPRMRVPASSTISSAIAKSRPQSSKGPSPRVPYATPVPTPTARVPGTERESPVDDDMLDADLSPNTAVSNNAPSLVSDDGEYDDSVADSESESEVDDRLDARSISDVEEIDIDGDHTVDRHHHGSTGAGAGTTVRLRKDDSKHVTFVSPVKNSGKRRRAQKFTDSAPL